VKGEIGSKEGRDVITDERTLLGSLNLRRRKMDRLRVDNSPAPMIPLTIENGMFDIKTEAASPAASKEEEEDEDEEEEDPLNSSLTPMDWLPRLNAKAGMVEEELPEEKKKPPYSYASLIRLAIINSESQKATLADIYHWIQEKFPYYHLQTNQGWKNSIRHNLSLNKSFMKVARGRQDPGKGCYWAINHLHSLEKQGGFEKKKKSFLIGPEWSGTSLQQLRQSLEREQQARQLQRLLVELQMKQQEQVQQLEAQRMLEKQQQHQQQLALQLQQQQMLQQRPLVGEEDWATNTEADLSPYTDLGSHEDTDSFDSFCNLQGPESQLLQGPVKMEVTDTLDGHEATSILLDPPCSSSSSQSSMYRCVNPMEVLGTVPSPDTLKLPSLWSPWQRPSSPSEPWTKEDLRMVPEDTNLDDIDYDKLL